MWRLADATQNVNINTNFNDNPATPSVVSLPAIASFEIQGTSTFKVLLGGWSSDTAQVGQCAHCFPITVEVQLLNSPLPRVAHAG